ncbi:cell division protein FtsZ [Prevotella sp. kh1p2]|uniref:cell division protein FtsZ n=1 Tax=Prevotella sp. kh1p2 TaxID=1761883 RepID=UPI0008C02E0B|nr:cell division protein FtsZ [Prevotella sp. kh1p2]SET29128.1 FtsZ family, C-terminal domain [Prevotella sp. kh1p2]SNU12532.1 FtsZ family, C-terminal domain [Prevotellaceae bacterium KH2P17]
MEEFDIGSAPILDFGPVEDKTKDIIKVIGVGGGGQNAVANMFNEGIANVTFAVCNTDSQALSKSPVPVKIPLGELGAGADPEKGRQSAEEHREDISHLLDDGTKMAFVTAGMGGGTGTGAAPVIAGIAKDKGILTIGIVTIPFYFEKKKKIVKALKGVEEMRKNVDALLIINNERICDIYADTQVTIKESFRRADQILCDATKSISELITVEGDINLDFCDVETTLRGGGGAIMAMGRAKGEHRVERAVIDALDSPLLYGNDIDKAKRILFNIYTSEEHPLFVSEMTEIDAFMDALDPNIDVIWGVSDDNTLGEDAKVTILATGFEDDMDSQGSSATATQNDAYFESLIEKLYKPYQKKMWSFTTPTQTAATEPKLAVDIPFTLSPTMEEEKAETDSTPSLQPTPVEVSTTETPMQAAVVTEPKAEYQADAIEPAEPATPTPGTEIHNQHVSKQAAEPLYPADGEWDKRPTVQHRGSFLQRAKGLLDKITELTQDP